MSDHEGTPVDTGYSTPVPELDDHRRQSVSVHIDRSRRGTVDSMRGAIVRENITNLGLVNEGLLRSTAPDYEQAVVDDDAPLSPGQRSIINNARVRRATISSVNGRSDSPADPAKAFGRFGRDHTVVEQQPAIVVSDINELHRTISGTSNTASRGRRLTKETDSESVKSFASNKSVEEDVCFPPHYGNNKNGHGIDFEMLEQFIADEQFRSESAEPTRVFSDQRNNKATTCFTSDGGITDAPAVSDASSIFDVKEKRTITRLDTRVDAQRPENRFEFFSSWTDQTIHASEFGDLVLPGEDMQSLFTVPTEVDSQDGSVWWLHMNNPTNEEVKGITKAFGVHPLTLEDIVDREAREKIELFPSYYFAVFRSFNAEEADTGLDFISFNTYVIVFREGSLSFSFTPNRHATNVRRRIASLRNHIVLNSDFICYAMIDDIVDKFGPFISQIETDSEKIEDLVFVVRSDDMQAFLRQIGMVRKHVMALMKLMGGKADVLKGFTKRCNANYMVTPKMDIGLYLGDVQDHVVTMMSSLAHFEKMLSRSHANYLAGLSIDSIQQGNRANEVLSRITLLAAILVPLNLVCGLFGMNVKVPFQDTQSLAPWFTIVGFLFFVVFGSFFLARRMRWF